MPELNGVKREELPPMTVPAQWLTVLEAVVSFDMQLAKKSPFSSRSSYSVEYFVSGSN